MTDDPHAESDTCPTCGKPAHPKHFLGACGPVSTWPNRAAPRKESVVSDDPGEILKAAGVECAEVEAAAEVEYECMACDRVAILALARIVAKQRGMLELVYTDYEARWNPDWGSFRQHDAWFSDLEADNARPDD